MVAGMLDKAFESVPDGINLLFYSDQGWQSQNRRIKAMLKRACRLLFADDKPTWLRKQSLT